MRFLCLHGHGTNSQILETQLEPLRAHLPTDWEFDFLDGEMAAEPATGEMIVQNTPTRCHITDEYILSIGIDQIFPGPYLCYHGEPVPSDVWNAYNLIMDVVREEGPFDGVIAFSQGAAVAATIIAHEAEVNPEADVFKVAVFLSATMPFDMEAGLLTLMYNGHVDTIEAKYQSQSNAAHCEIDNNVNWLEDCRTAGVIQEFQARRAHLHGSGRQSIDVLLRYHPSIHDVKIGIPTVHVIGMKDDYADHGRNLAGICDPKVSRVVTHEGGHQLPRDARTLAKTAEAIQWAVDRTLFLN
ncbi:hypothetical protein N7457_002998 [Penicillium paradoxum]|uniref:uncharacterized protein n=1 Tax=Penicillium paradoxum TaxID=176176 RepID=UPI00254874A3|nr:uncharacterized protein N7457_002998 [Penicillium paradoxum]KAJ5788008.1 hypothetical protein N7457_002998 [Penicillium paradoxum]